MQMQPMGYIIVRRAFGCVTFDYFTPPSRSIWGWKTGWSTSAGYAGEVYTSNFLLLIEVLYVAKK